jgi:hypothetical protein
VAELEEVDSDVDSEDRIVEIEVEVEVASKEEVQASRVRNPIWNATTIVRLVI